MQPTRERSDPTRPLTENTGLISVRGGRIEVIHEDARLQIGTEPLLIGRSRQCHLVLDDSTVSAVHLQVKATPQGVHVADQKSRNGTFFNGGRFTEGYLTSPCELRCGAKPLRFIPDPPHDVAINRQTRFGGLVGTTPEMLELMDFLRQYAPSSMPILIRGETGTGKERVARAIHDASGRKGRFVAINCGSMNEALLEAELFGHVRGAFTGAVEERKGLFVEAHGGTLFFDEVAEMPATLQVKLLRVIEYLEVRPVGSDRTRKVDVRALFATHANLDHAVNLGRFRADMLYRIGLLTVEIPPLRKRMDDIELLLENIFEELGRPDVTIDGASLEMVKARSWRGNMRELRHLVEAALFGAQGTVISLRNALPARHHDKKVTPESGPYEIARREFERDYYTRLYAQCRGSVARIARVSGRERSTVRVALRALGLVAAPDDSAAEGGGEGPESTGRHDAAGPAGRKDS